jgi:tripartite motif-containing protein 2/3
MLTRQTSAPPLGERSPSSNIPYPPPSLLATYSSTNSGGSSNGNNSRSTTPFSGVTQSSTIDINLNGLSQSSLIRRTGQSMQVRAKFGSLGPQKCQFNAPHGFCLGIDEEIIVADTNNHRIQIFDKMGEYKYQFGRPGKEEGQLWYPRKVAVMRQSGKFVICDRGNERSRMQIFTRNGHFIRKISIRYIDIVAGLAITQQGNIVAVDSVSPTVFCISESGDLIKWFDCSDYMREPSDIAIFNNEYFVCDFKGHCVVVFDEDGTYLRRIGSESLTNFPNGIDISDAGDVIIGDSHGNRFHIAVFTRTGDFLQEFDCPYVKVSRCCGLKITSDGFIVTLAKNNHHVLVLNTLYLT